LTWLATILLAAAQSVDSFSVGLVYVARGIRLTGRGLSIIAVSSASVNAVAMFFGAALGRQMDPQLGHHLGAGILIVVGLWVLFQTWRSTGRHLVAAPNASVATDVHHRGNISPSEAVMLGLALAIDSLAAGLGAGMTGFDPRWLPPMVGVATWLSLGAVSFLSSRITWQLHGRWSMLPGAVLMALGLSRLWALW
jgi:putative Mn2+ efflux pump MntP